MLPRAPLPPAKKDPFADMDVTAAMEMVNADRQTMTGLRGSKMPILLLILGAIIMAGAIALLVMQNYLPGGHPRYGLRASSGAQPLWNAKA